MTAPELDRPRCGFCKALVSGDTMMVALESEAYDAHPDSVIRRVPGSTDVIVYACDENTGCMS